MYTIYFDDELFCDSRVDDLAIISPVVELEANKAGSFTFTIPPTHPYYDKLLPRKTVITVYRDDETEPIFEGMCTEYTDDFYKQRNVTCEGALSWLNDSIQRPYKVNGMTVKELLTYYLTKHNGQVGTKKMFLCGDVTVTDSTNAIYCYANWNTTMTEIKEDLVDDLGGYLRIRHNNGNRYLDYLAEAPHRCSQIIKLGENLKNYSSNLDTQDIATVVIPLGATQDEQEIEGLDSYLTIKSVNDWNDYLTSTTATAYYGHVEKVINFDDVTDASNLKAKGEDYLTSSQFASTYIEANAIDLHYDDESVEHYNLLDLVHVISDYHGLDKWMMLTKMTVNLNNPENDTITLGSTVSTSMSAKSAEASEKAEKAPTETILQQAIKSATNRITGVAGGYVVIHQDDSGNPYEILIMDEPKIQNATKIWRWNNEGLGYSSTGYEGPYGLAMTSDGAIVADYITTGTLTSLAINNGNGTFTVDSSGNCKANSFTSSNASITGGSLSVIGTYQSSSDMQTQIKNGRILETGSIALGTDSSYPSCSISQGGGLVIQSADLNGSGRNFWTEMYPERIFVRTSASSDVNKCDHTTWISPTDLYVNGVRIHAYTPTDTAGFIYVNTDGVAELGTYLDWHQSNSKKDYSCRLMVPYSNANTVNLPSASGTLALSSSDVRIKENIKDSEENALDFINNIKVRQFDWKAEMERYSGDKSGTHQKIGFIADELEELDENLAFGGGWNENLPNGEEKTMNIKCIDTFYLMGYVVKAMQEMSAEIDELKSEIETLKGGN